MFYKNAIRQCIAQCMELLFDTSVRYTEEFALHDFFRMKGERLAGHHVRVLKCQCRFQIASLRTNVDAAFVDFSLLYTLLAEKQGKFFHTEGGMPCKCEFEKGRLYRLYLAEPRQTVEDLICPPTVHIPRIFSQGNRSADDRQPNAARGGYDALEAVKYAERYWNGYNPQYPKFENDCTNFISQCLFAGGAKMTGGADRTKGWWMYGKEWSYSWTTAHAFYLYLITSRTGLRAKETGSQRELLLGDVICYDFEGDGRINHTTIVVAKTADGDPLVNAHTYNSRNRLWSYEDSTAYTDRIQYKFLQIYL